MSEILKLPSAEQLDIANKRERYAVAYPMSRFELESKPNGFGQTIQVSSIGYDDGMVYGWGSSGFEIFRCGNAFETMTSADIERGQSFDEVAGFNNRIIGVYKTKAGYVVIETSYSLYTSAIWFSTDFDSGFVKVATLDRGQVNPFNIYNYVGTDLENESVMLVGEYISNFGGSDPGLRLFASYDGGATWQVIKTLPTTDLSGGTQSIHWHHAVYDEYEGRIWASAGDGENAVLYTSYDLGATWDIVPLSSYQASGLPSHHPQPTLIIPTPEKIVIGHDNGVAGGLMSIIRDKKTPLINEENLSWQVEIITDRRRTAASGSYATPHIARYGSEIYVLINSLGDNNTIIGSGDNGQTWHFLGSINKSASNGIVGVDKNGYIYIYVTDSSRVYKLKKPQWVYA